MTDRTKLIIAVTAGLVGLALAIFATIVAVNARDKADNEAAVQQQVSRQVGAALRAQAAKDARQVSGAEKFVQSLDRGERKVTREIIRLRRSIRQLKASVLAIESDQADEFSRVNRRITATNEDVAALQNKVRRIQNELDFDGGSNP